MSDIVETSAEEKPVAELPEGGKPPSPLRTSTPKKKKKEKFNLAVALEYDRMAKWEETHDGPFMFPDGKKFYL